MNDRCIGKNLAPGVMALVVLALAWMLLYAPALQADAAASTPTVAVEADADPAPVATYARVKIKVKPKPVGQTCSYTCEGSTTNWTLVCGDSEEECQEAANVVCQALYSTNTSSFSC